MDQHRNPHRLLLDFADELDLYSQAGQLVQHLLDWRPRATRFEDQMIEVASSMAEKGFWKARHVCTCASNNLVTICRMTMSSMEVVKERCVTALDHPYCAYRTATWNS